MRSISDWKARTAEGSPTLRAISRRRYKLLIHLGGRDVIDVIGQCFQSDDGYNLKDLTAVNALVFQILSDFGGETTFFDDE